MKGVDIDQWQRERKGTEDEEGNRIEKVGIDGKKGQEHSINHTMLTNYHGTKQSGKGIYNSFFFLLLIIR